MADPVPDFEIPETLDYQARIARIQKQPIVIWDVLQSCIRTGSLDSAIMEEHPNALAEFLTLHPSITTIAFNGQKAAKSFKRHITLPRDIHLITLPSTSPAYAGMKFEEKLKIWESALSSLRTP